MVSGTASPHSGLGGKGLGSLRPDLCVKTDAENRGCSLGLRRPRGSPWPAETTGLLGTFPLPLQVTPLMAWFPLYRPGLGCWGFMYVPASWSRSRPQGRTEGCPRESGEARALSCPPCPRACSLHTVRGCPPLFYLFSPSEKSPSAVALRWRSPVAPITQEKRLLWGAHGACRGGGPSGCQSWPLSIPPTHRCAEAALCPPERGFHVGF